MLAQGETDGEQGVAHVANIVGQKRSDIRFWLRIRSDEPQNAYSEAVGPAGAHGAPPAERPAKKVAYKSSDIRSWMRMRIEPPQGLSSALDRNIEPWVVMKAIASAKGWEVPMDLTSFPRVVEVLSRNGFDDCICASALLKYPNSRLLHRDALLRGENACEAAATACDGYICEAMDASLYQRGHGVQFVKKVLESNPQAPAAWQCTGELIAEAKEIDTVSKAERWQKKLVKAVKGLSLFKGSYNDKWSARMTWYGCTDGRPVKNDVADRWVEFGPLQDRSLKETFVSSQAAMSFVNYTHHPLLFECWTCQYVSAAKVLYQKCNECWQTAVKLAASHDFQAKLMELSQSSTQVLPRVAVKRALGDGGESGSGKAADLV